MKKSRSPISSTGSSYQLSKCKFESDPAAIRALKSITLYLIKHLNLLDTTHHLYAMGGLTSLEMEKIASCNTESLSKELLITLIIPRKGPCRGMTLLRQALKQSEQFEIVNTLEKAYEDALDAILHEKLKTLQKLTEVKHDPDSPVQQHQHPLLPYAHRTIRHPVSQTSTTTVSVPSMPHKKNLHSIDHLPTMKFVFVGDVGTGKTSLLERYVNNKFSTSVGPTVRFVLSCLVIAM